MKRILFAVSLVAAVTTHAQGEVKDIVDIASASKDHTTLVTALKAADYVTALKNPGPLTVFAPTNAAFDKLPAATIDKLKTDSQLLTSILTYHVVSGQASPTKVDGSHKTLQGANVTVTGMGNDIKANDAGLVCGGVHTANATVYMIDTVLMPPAQ